MMIFNHRVRELHIGVSCDCNSDHLKLKIAGYYTTHNKISVAYRRGEDLFFLSSRGPKSDLSDAIILNSRYLVIGCIRDLDSKILDACSLQNKSLSWMEAPQSLYETRLLIAGASRIISVIDTLPNPVAQAPEYKKALLENRVFEVVSC